MFPGLPKQSLGTRKFTDFVVTVGAERHLETTYDHRGMYADLNTGAVLFQMKDSGIHGFWYGHKATVLPST